MKFSSLLVVALCVYSVQAQCSKGVAKWPDRNSFAVKTIRPASLFDASGFSGAKVLTYEKCPGMLIIESIRVWTKHSNNIFRPGGDRFSLFDKLGNVNVKASTCFEMKNLKTIVSKGFVLYAACNNKLFNCKIYYDVKSYCKSMPRSSVTVPTSAPTATPTTAAPAVWNGAGCPRFQQVNRSCHDANDGSCAIANVSQSDFKAVCAEYANVAACTASVSAFPSIKNRYEELCLQEPAITMWNGRDCLEFQRVNASCHSNAEGCLLDKVSTADLKAVCDERKVPACAASIATDPDISASYEEFCEFSNEMSTAAPTRKTALSSAGLALITSFVVWSF